MVWFAIAHAVQLVDGTFAVTCPELPGCETRNARIDLAREEFATALRCRVLDMIDVGEKPPLYTLEELRDAFAERCKHAIPRPDRAPGTFDSAIPVRAKLPASAGRRLTMLRTGRPLPANAASELATEVRNTASSATAQPVELALGPRPDGQPTVLSEIEDIIDSFASGRWGRGEAEHQPAMAADNAAPRAEAQPLHNEPTSPPDVPQASVRADQPSSPARTDKLSARNPTRSARMGVLWRAGVQVQQRDPEELTSPTTAR
jgi:hypothetical protein